MDGQPYHCCHLAIAGASDYALSLMENVNIVDYTFIIHQSINHQCALILLETLALYKLFTYLLTYLHQSHFAISMVLQILVVTFPMLFRCI